MEDSKKGKYCDTSHMQDNWWEHHSEQLLHATPSVSNGSFLWSPKSANITLGMKWWFAKPVKDSSSSSCLQASHDNSSPDTFIEIVLFIANAQVDCCYCLLAIQTAKHCHDIWVTRQVFHQLGAFAHNYLKSTHIIIVHATIYLLIGRIDAIWKYYCIYHSLSPSLSLALVFLKLISE